MGFEDDLASYNKAHGAKAPAPAETESGGSSFEADLAKYGETHKNQAPQDTPEDPLKGAIRVGRQIGAQTVLGAAHGLETLDNGLQNVSASMQNAIRPGMTAQDYMPPENQEPADFSSAVQAQHKGILAQGNREHPYLSLAARSAGEQVPMLAPFELGAGAVGMGMKAAVPALQAAGPMGAALLKGVQSAPAALKAIEQLTASGTGGAFIQGMTEDAGKQSKGGQTGKLDFKKAFQAGLIQAMEAAPVIAGLGAGGEMITQLGSKVMQKVAKQMQPLLKMNQKQAESEQKIALKAQQEQASLSFKQNKRDQEWALKQQKKLDDEFTKPFQDPTLQVKAERVFQAVKDGVIRQEQGYNWFQNARLQDQHLADQSTIAGHKQKLEFKRQAKAQQESEHGAARDKAAAESTAVLNAEHYKLAEQHAQELMGEPQGLTSNAREESHFAEREGVGVSRAAMYNLQHEGGIRRAQQALGAEPQGSTSNARELINAAEREGAGASRAEALNREHQAAAEQSANEMGGEVSPPLSFARQLSRATEQSGKQPLRLGGLRSDIESIPEQTGPSEFSLRAEQNEPYTPQPEDRWMDKRLDKDLRKRERVQIGGREKFRNTTDYDALQKEEEFDGDTGDPWAGFDEDVQGGIRALSPGEQKIVRDIVDDAPLLGMNGAEAVRWAKKAIENIKAGKLKSELTYDGVVHYVNMAQKFKDIYHQYDDELASAMGGAYGNLGAARDSLAETFSKARGEVKMTFMKSGLKEGDLWVKGLRGNLTPEEEKLLTPQNKTAIAQGRKAVDKYLGEIQKRLDWFDANVKGQSSRFGLGRLRKTLQLQKQELQGFTAGGAPGNAKGVLQVIDNLATGAAVVGKPHVSVWHGIAKFIESGVDSPVGLAKAIGGVMRSPESSRFTSDFLRGSAGVITESLGESGVKLGRVLDAITGKPFESGANRLAVSIGLQKAAQKTGYKSAEELAKDLNAAMRGEGPLVFDSTKQIDAYRAINDHVGDLTGLNVPGFRDSNILQRNPELRFMNRFLTARIQQTAFGARLIGNVVNAKSAKDLAIASAKLGAYFTATTAIAGGTIGLGREADAGIKASFAAMGNLPGYYHLNDDARKLRGMVPSVEHLAPTANPFLSAGGTNAPQVLREQINGALTAKDPEKLAEAAGYLFGGSVFGIGTGAAGGYVKAGNDIKRGYEDVKAFAPGVAEGHMVAHLPMETNAARSMSEMYFGLEPEDKARVIYAAEKLSDMRKWVANELKDNPRQLEALKRREQNIPEIRQVTKIMVEEARRIKNRPDDKADIQEDHKQRLAEGNLKAAAIEAAAEHWLDAADEIRSGSQSKQQQQPAPALVSG